MELTSCPTCGHSVSDMAPTCPHCGQPGVTEPSVPRVPAILTSYPLFPVSMDKFITLSIFSFTAFSLYWFYENGKRLQATSHEKPESVLAHDVRATVEILALPLHSYHGSRTRRHH